MSQHKSLSGILRATGLLGSVQVLHVLISIVRNKLTAVFIGANGMGLVDLYNRSIEFICQATNFGIGFSAIRSLSNLYETGTAHQCRRFVKLIRSWTLTLSVLGMLVCILMAPWIARWSGGQSSALGYLRLSPMVAFLTLTGGEMAILKATRQLKTLALNTAISAFCTLILTAIFYGAFGMHGIIPVLLSGSFCMLAINLWSTTRMYPYRVSVNVCFLREGGPIIKLGLAYIGAGILGSGSELLIRDFIVSDGGLHTAGLYAAGLTLTVSYARIIFVAMDADYFPRLSVAFNTPGELSPTVNRQIDALVLLMTPFLALFAIFLPFIIRLLYTPDFLAAMPMVLAALSYMFFKAVYAPIAYLSLAKGDSLVYFIMELIYDVVFCGLVVLGYSRWGLFGAGLALSASNLIDLILLWSVYHFRYGYNMEFSTLWRTFIQGLLLAGVLVLCAQDNSLLHYLAGGILAAFSVFMSFRLLSRETHIIKKLFHR